MSAGGQQDVAFQSSTAYTPEDAELHQKAVAALTISFAQFQAESKAGAG